MKLRNCLLAATAGVFASSAAAHASPLELEDLFNLKSVGSVAISPDGDMVAYSLSSTPNITTGAKNGTASSEIRLHNGESDRLYIPSNYRARSVQWGDANTLFFVGTGPGDSQNALWSLDIAGGAPEKVFSFDRNLGAAVLSDDGDTLYFSATEKRSATSAAARKMGFDVNVIDEDFRFRSLYSVDLTKDGAKPKAMSLPGHVSTFAVSPDGERLVVALAPTPLVGDDIINRKFNIVDASSGRVEHTLATEGKIGGAAFSPDGSKIAFFAGTDRNDPVARTIGVADARTGEFEFLTGDDEQDEMDMFWSNDNAITVLYHDGLTTGTYTLSPDGEISDRTVSDVALASIDGNGAGMAAVGHSSAYPRALFTTGANGSLTKATAHNAWLDDKDLPTQEAISWTARDGVQVEGLLITPSGRTPRGGWPMVTIVHGGPEAHYSDGWVTRYSEPGHVLAGDGFAAFYPNYRGSTGRGQGFAKLDHADPPAAEFNDVVDGIGYLADQGIINRAKVGITGASYGGFASAWGATALTEHFAASVAFVGLTDLTSFMGTTDIPTEMVDSHFMVPPEGNWDLYREWSPIYHAAKSKTPTLIAHGEADPRVHPSQSLELYRYLKRVGQAPVRLVTYPGEGHGNRKAAGQYDYGLRLLRWMDHYLKGDGGDMPPIEVPEIQSLAE